MANMVRVRWLPLGERHIEKSDLDKNWNIKVSDDMHWVQEFNWAVDVENMSDALEALLEQEGGFRIEPLEDGQKPLGKVITVKKS